MAETPVRRRRPGRLRRRLAEVRVRVGLVATVAVVLTLVVGGVGLVALLHRNLINSLHNQAQVQAAEVADLAQRGPLPKPLPAVNTPNLTLVQVVDAHGQVIDGSAPLLDRSPVISVRPGRLNKDITLDHPGFAPDQKFVAIAIPVTLNGQPATVIVASSMAELEHSLHLLGKFLLIALPILVALVATAMWLIIGRSLRPVEAMRAEVAEITTRQLNRRVPEPAGGDEVGRLASTLNGMLDRLERSTDRQRRFVADASHELRSPIANIGAALEVALRHPEVADWPAVARDILNQDERMASLVEELLLLARFDETTSPPATSPIDLADVAERQAERAPLSGPRVEVAHVEPAIVLADPGHLDRVVTNLVDNAVRHASERVQLSVRRDGPWAEMEVRDDGPGVPPEDRDRIFERFVRLEEDRARSSGGFGLGLAIVKELVGLYGGTIKVTDGHPGAVFTVRFPLGPGADEPTDRGLVLSQP
jgi:signal transduction histidine kinase